MTKTHHKPSSLFTWIVLIFGFLSLLAVYPLTSGDEGYHLSKSYTMFSAQRPDSTSESFLRGMELTAISQPKAIDLKKFYSEKLADVEQDKIGFQLLTDINFTLLVDVGHLIPALGVLLARFIYPSYGVMLIFARLFNLIFFVIGMHFILKRSKENFFTYLMIFTVPFMQKIASPSYDVLAFLAIAAFGSHYLHLARLKKFSELSKKDMSYTLFTIFLILLTKKNYIFALTALAGLPMFYSPLLRLIKKQSQTVKVVLATGLGVLALLTTVLVHKVFHLKYLLRAFFNNYFNVATMGGRGQTLFSVVQDNLPQLINILWIIALVLVVLGESRDERYRFGTATTGLAVYLLNWLGIFLGFYILHPDHGNFDDLTGRYLHAYMVMLIPLFAWLACKMKFSISEKAIKNLALMVTVGVLALYLLITFYRGFILGITPAWQN